MEAKKLYRKSSNKKICGVCAGVAEYFNVDVTMVRIIWVILTFIFFGGLAYLIAAIALPEQE